MEGPLSKILEWTMETQFVWALLIGIGFGFFLERGGFGSSKKLALQFYFRDLTVFKVMFTAIITAMTGLIYMSSLGWIQMDLIYLNPSYLWAGLIGGLIMGAGFIIGGYCPGTSLVGLSTLKIDSIFYLLGCLIGMFIFGETFSYFKDFMVAGNLGKRLTLPDYFGLSAGVIGFFVILGALLCFYGAEILEDKLGKKEEEGVL